MLGYYKNHDATAKYFHTDENGNVWACTGDMGYVTEDGSVYVDGRISDSYTNAQGETIYLFDIERAVLGADSVRQCRAVASEINGKITHVAHTVLDNEVSQDGALKQIHDLCKNRLKPNHLPTLFKFYKDALPVAPSGKLDVAKMKNNTENIVEYNVKV